MIGNKKLRLNRFLFIGALFVVLLFSQFIWNPWNSDITIDGILLDRDTTRDGKGEHITWIDDLPSQEQDYFARCCNETLAQERWPCMSSCRPSLTRFFKSPNEYFHFLPIHIIPETSKKVISYSLYGSKERYQCNAISIIGENRRFYPDWIIRFYVGADVPSQTIKRLVDNGCEVIAVYMISNDLVAGYHGMFWRFFVADDLNVDRYMIRDADTWPIQREKDAVLAWIKSATGFHVMRDHEGHSVQILGGMWGGVVNPKVLNMSTLYAKTMKLEWFRLADRAQMDQNFLSYYVWPIVRRNMTCHASFHSNFANTKCQPFPTERKGNQFVGQIHEVVPSDCDFQNETRRG